MMMVEAGKAIVRCGWSGENKWSGCTRTALLVGVGPPHGCQVEGL